MYTKEMKMLFANLDDKYLISKKKNIMIVSNFIDESQLDVVVAFLKGKKYEYSIYRMNDQCEKVVVVFGDISGSVVTCFRVVNNGYLHKDILGSLFSLGLNSDVIGDIFIEDDYCYFIVANKIKDVIINELVMIRNNYISLEEVFEIDNVIKKYEIIKLRVSSLRIDLVLSKLLSRSRNQIQELFSDNKVLCNYRCIKSCSYLLKKNDVLSIRGYGKYKIGEIIESNSNINLEVLKSC